MSSQVRSSLMKSVIVRTPIHVYKPDSAPSASPVAPHPPASSSRVSPVLRPVPLLASSEYRRQLRLRQPCPSHPSRTAPSRMLSPARRMHVQALLLPAGQPDNKTAGSPPSRRHKMRPPTSCGPLVQRIQQAAMCVD